jgi:predicted RNA-binding Zn-ribbon protein involved in translation (DUF1610 family)
MTVTLGNYTELQKAGRIKEITLSMAGKAVPDVVVMECPVCNVPIQETLTGCRPMGEQFYCSDCYFDKIGEWLDEHPLGVSHVQR